MLRTTKNKDEDPLLSMVAAAEPRVLADPILELARREAGVRRYWLEYQGKVILPQEKQQEAEGEAL